MYTDYTKFDEVRVNVAVTAPIDLYIDGVYKFTVAVGKYFLRPEGMYRGVYAVEHVSTRERVLHNHLPLLIHLDEVNEAMARAGWVCGAVVVEHESINDVPMILEDMAKYGDFVMRPEWGSRARKLLHEQERFKRGTQFKETPSETGPVRSFKFMGIPIWSSSSAAKTFKDSVYQVEIKEDGSEEHKSGCGCLVLLLIGAALLMLHSCGH